MKAHWGQRALAPSCHSGSNSFISDVPPPSPVPLSAWLLAVPAHTFRLHLLDLVIHTKASLCSFFHFYLLCLFPKIHSPVILLFFPPCLGFITLPANASLSLICFSYSLSHLSMPFPPNRPLFTASLHLLLPFSNLAFFSFFFLILLQWSLVLCAYQMC